MGALILLIIIAVPMILTIIDIIRERSRGIFDDDAWGVLLVSVIIFMFGCFFLIPCLVMGYQSVDTKKYDRILRDIEYSTTYSIETEERIIEWNKSVNDWNNLFCRFSIEDRSAYKIDVEVYLDKFKEE